MMSTLLGNKENPKIFVISAPAGSGKTTLAQKLYSEFPNEVVQSISCTTREKRPHEVDGKDYIFLSKEAFDKKIQEKAFLEHTAIFGHHYGTLKETVEKLKNNKKHVVLIIDTEGAAKIRKMLEVVSIFIYPPSMHELEKRLKHRNTETPEEFQRRVNRAQEELKQMPNYDYSVLNDDLDTAYQILRSIIIAEGHKKKSHQ